MTKDAGDPALEREVAHLSGLTHSALAAQWQTRCRTAPPKGMSGKLLLLALTYQIQASAYADLDSKTKRYLHAVANGSTKAVPPRAAATSTLKPGMRLAREWNGRTHTVEVIEDGFLWNGEHHKSLSAIARAITGARWSGPRFFGLTS